MGISDISNSNGIILRTEKSINDEGLQNSSSWIVPKGSISLAMYASVGKIAVLNIDLATSQAFYNMVFNDDSLRDFVYYRLIKAYDFNEWSRLISTGTQDNLNAQKVKDFVIELPNATKEIEYLGMFFNNLSNFITLHQHKCEKIGRAHV